MIDNKEWIEKQQTKEEIEDNYVLFFLQPNFFSSYFAF